MPGRYKRLQSFSESRLMQREPSRIGDVRVARTIADLAGSEDVTRKHFAEAFLYRGSAS